MQHFALHGIDPSLQDLPFLVLGFYLLCDVLHLRGLRLEGGAELAALVFGRARVRCSGLAKTDKGSKPRRL